MPATPPKFDPSINYYEVLDVPYTATKAEVTRAYRRLMRHAHPDRFQSPRERAKAEERAKLLNAAYAVLSRPEVRREYDRAIRQRAVGDALFQRYTGNVPGRGTPFATPRPPSPEMRRVQRRASHSAFLTLFLVVLLFVLALMALVVLWGLAGQVAGALLS